MATNVDDRYRTSAQFAQALASGSVITPSDTATLPQQVVASAKSVAVLPFSNMSTDAENEYFADGMAEEIINALSKIQSLRVASRTVSFALKGKNEDLRTVGSKLGVANVLEGSVRRGGGRVRITAQLVRASDGFHLARDLPEPFLTARTDDHIGAVARARQCQLAPEPRRDIETHHRCFDGKSAAAAHRVEQRDFRAPS